MMDVFNRRDILIESIFSSNKNKFQKSIDDAQLIFKKQMNEINKLFSKDDKNNKKLKVNEVGQNLKKYNKPINGNNLPFPLDKAIKYPDDIKNDIESMYDKIEKLPIKEFDNELVKKLGIDNNYKKTLKGLYDLATEYFYDDVFVEECVEYDPKILVDYYNNRNKIRIMLQKNEAIYISKWEILYEKIDMSNNNSIINAQKLVQIMMEVNKATIKEFKKVYNEIENILKITHNI